MADSKQLDILKALTAHLEGVNPENDYDEDLRGSVYRGRLIFGEDVTAPFLTILESPRPNPADEVADGTARVENWDLLLQGWAADDDENPADPAYQLKAMVEHRLSRLLVEDTSGMPTYRDEYRLGGRINHLRIGQGIVRPPTDSPSAKVCFYIPITIVLTANLANPFVAE